MIELDRKVVGLQIETRLGFKDVQTQMVAMDGKVVGLDGKVVGLQTEMRQRFAEMSQRVEQITLLLNTLINKPE
ncbi:MAG: hypothetical protein ABI234_01230 [Ktedonobacteraceae bacterium]